MPKFYKSICLYCNKPYKGRGVYFCKMKHQCLYRTKNGLPKDWVEKIGKSLKKFRFNNPHKERRRIKKLISYIKKHRGIKSSNWIGDNIGYKGLHKRLPHHPKRCKKCGIAGRLVGKKRKVWNIQWANISKKYLPKKSDFVPLCHKCHHKFDTKSFKRNSLGQFIHVINETKNTQFGSVLAVRGNVS